VTDPRGRFETEPVVPAGVVRVVHLERRMHFGQELDPTLFVVPEGLQEGAAHDLELILQEGDHRMDVQVAHRGRGVPASVEVRLEKMHGGLTRTCATDPQGRLEVSFDGVEGIESVHLLAWAENLASSPRRVDFPWQDETVALELEVTGQVLVRARATSGEPLAGLWIWANQRHARTDVEGRALFERVAVGKGRVGVGASSEWEEVEVSPGRVAEVDFVLPHERAVAGCVVDEAGKALGNVSVCVSLNTSSISLSTGADGKFQVYGPPGKNDGTVRVRLGLGPATDRFHPDQVSVPFGTLDLIFRRKADVKTESSALSLIDAQTRRSIERGQVVLYREGFPDWYDDYEIQDGVVVCSFKPLPDLRMRTIVPGYRDRVLDLIEFGQRAGRVEPLVLPLEPGFARWLRVHDVESDKPISGARIFDGDVPVATTDADGKALVDLARWPAELRISSEGFETDTWSRWELAEDPFQTIWLDQVE
jgi:hypothetical protein